jgi:hypothetical protein
MRKIVAVSDAMAWPLLLPGDLACRAFGLSSHQDLMRMLFNSVFWTVLGVLVVVVTV